MILFRDVDFFDCTNFIDSIKILFTVHVFCFSQLGVSALGLSQLYTVFPVI